MNASPDLERYLRVQIVNNAIREIFLNQFAHMFSVYEYFFTQPNQVQNSFLKCLRLRNIDFHFLKSCIGYGFLAVESGPSAPI